MALESFTESCCDDCGFSPQENTEYKSVTFPNITLHRTKTNLALNNGPSEIASAVPAGRVTVIPRNACHLSHLATAYQGGCACHPFDTPLSQIHSIHVFPDNT